MKKLLTFLLIIYPPASVPEMINLEAWQMIGWPCTTQIDKLEGTCGKLGIKSKIVWE